MESRRFPSAHRALFVLISCAAFIAAYISCSLPVHAQNATGRVIGIVSDPAGALVTGAKVIVTNTATGIRAETTTGGDGSYQVLDVPIGNYTVTVQREGFGTAVTQASQLQINQTLRIDVHLTLGAVSQTVAVEAQAAQVETEVPTVGGTVTGATVQNLPLNGRNTLDLALTQPGVVPAPAYSNPFTAGTFTIAGGRSDAINFILDGGNNTSVNTNAVVLNPNPDSVAEFRILSNNYTAEYGRGSGGVVSVVIKSGTNQLHGSLYEYLRNEDFNASDYFSNEAGLPRPILKRNQFGGTLGGPIVIPKIVNGKDRLFFFFGYQGQRQSQVQVDPGVTVYTPAELQGNFSHAVNGGPDPNVVNFLQANPYFQGNSSLASQAIIDPAKINPIAQNYIAAGLVPSSSSGVLYPQGSATDNRDEYTGKIDFYASQTDRISGTFGWANDATLAPFTPGGSNVPGYPGLSNQKQRSLNIAYTKTISPTLINEARATVQRFLQDENYPGSKLPTSISLGTQINSDYNFGPAILVFASGMTTGFNVNGPTEFHDTSYSYSDTITWIKGHHTMKGGFTFNAAQNNSYYSYGTNGSFFFDGPAGIGSSNDLADFLFGLPDFYDQYPKALTNIRTKGYWGFFQDEWKVTPRLLLTIGMRYEYTTPLTDTAGRTYTYQQGLQSQRFVDAPLGLVVGGDPGAPTGEFRPDKNNFAPRFGFAWDPFGDGRTSIRGGFGVFFDTIRGFSITWANGTPPWYPSANIFFNPVASIGSAVPYMSDPYGSTGSPDPFPTIPTQNIPKTLNFAALGYLPFGNSAVMTDPNLRNPYIYQYNMSVQRQIGRTLVAEVNYVGNSGHKLLANLDINPMILGTTNRIIDTLPGVAPGSYTQLSAISNIGHSNYNALLTSLTKRVGDWHSMGETFFTVSYTWSHALDNSSGWLGPKTNTVPAYNHDQFYGNSDFDIRQRFVLSGGWEIPFAHLWSSGPKKLTTGWRLFPILTVQAGQPLNVSANLRYGLYGTPGPSGAGDSNLVNANLAGNSIQTYNPASPQVINGVYGNYYFNPNSFAQNPASWTCGTCIPTASERTYGTYPRDNLVGPGFTNFDLSLEKKTLLFGERLQTAFRVEAFNLLNHAEFWTPNTNIFGTTFGQITSVNPSSPSRIIQLALRVNF